MYRAICGFGLFIASLCGTGFMVSHSLSPLTFLMPDGVVAIISFVLAMVLLHFALFSYFRQDSFKRFFAKAGIVLILSAAYGVLWPRYFNLLQNDIKPANLMIMLMGGIALLTAAAEQPRESFSPRLANLHLSLSAALLPLAKTFSKSNHRLALPASNILESDQTENTISE